MKSDEEIMLEMAKRMADAGIKDPWSFISDDAKNMVAWLRFYQQLLLSVRPKL